ncbi:MAG: ATP-dependent 6-phosphofructokinase [Thermoguttaceae bacterium]
MRIGVLCSGGDAPGMNACIRGVVRAAHRHGHEVVGIRRGYQGILDEDFHIDADGNLFMGPRSVSGLSRQGGTILYSSRCARMMEPGGVQEVAAVLRKRKIDALIPIGGNGTLTGAMNLLDVWEGKIVGLPGTIDNDLRGTDYTIGFATAVETAVDALDKLSDTAGSHHLMFFVEVMGRHCGDIAVFAALASGAELVSIPELDRPIDTMISHLTEIKKLGKKSVMMVVAEGDRYGGANKLHAMLKDAGNPFDARVVVLGHVLRGGTPVPMDRILAARLGVAAVDALHDGHSGVMAGVINGDIALTPMADCIAEKRELDCDLQQLLKILAS